MTTTKYVSVEERQISTLDDVMALIYKLPYAELSNFCNLIDAKLSDVSAAAQHNVEQFAFELEQRKMTAPLNPPYPSYPAAPLMPGR